MIERLDGAREWAQRMLEAKRVRLEPASGDASFRRYFRIRRRGESVVLMDAPPEKEDSRPYITVSRLLIEAGVHAPRILAEDLEQGFLLLEDLGTRCFLDELSEDTAEILYGDAIEALLTMQTRVSADSVPVYDDRLVMNELSLFGDWFLDKHLGIDTSGDVGRRLTGSYDLICRHFIEHPRVFVHRDYHSRNLMRCATGNPGILDFQDAVAGPAVYDLVSLFRDVYIEWPESRVSQWLHDYHQRALAGSVPVAKDGTSFIRDVDFVGAQRHLKVAGIFCRLFYRDGKAEYLGNIPLTLRYLISECTRLPELEPLVRLICELDLETRLLERNSQVLAELVPQKSGST